MVKFYDKVYIRVAGATFTSIPKATLQSQWTVLPGTAKISQELSLKNEADVTTAMGDGTDYVGSEKATAEIQIVDVNMASFETMRTTFLGNLVDIVIYDSNSSSTGFALFGVKVYPGLEIGSGKESVLKISGTRRYIAGLSVVKEINLT
jgi:hypothetical protein